jgi:hypothetical protein
LVILQVVYGIDFLWETSRCGGGGRLCVSGVLVEGMRRLVGLYGLVFHFVLEVLKENVMRWDRWKVEGFDLETIRGHGFSREIYDPTLS